MAGERARGSGSTGESKRVAMWTFPIEGRDDVIEFLKDAGCEVRLGIPYEERDKKMSEEELAEAGRDAHGLMVSGRDGVTRKVLEADENLGGVSKRGIGTDKIDLDAPPTVPHETLR